MPQQEAIHELVVLVGAGGGFADPDAEPVRAGAEVGLTQEVPAGL